MKFDKVKQYVKDVVEVMDKDQSYLSLSTFFNPKATKMSEIFVKIIFIDDKQANLVDRSRKILKDLSKLDNKKLKNIFRSSEQIGALFMH